VRIEEICYVTFIRQIKIAFQADYETRDETKDLPLPWITTLHSLACRVIRNLGHTAKFGDGLYFLNIGDKGDFAARVFLDDFVNFSGDPNLNTRTKARKAIGGVKAEWQNDRDPSTKEHSLFGVASQVVALTHIYQALDWDYAVHTAISLIDKGAGLDWLWKRKHWMVDEYQDFNQAEQRLLASAVARADSVVIVGDDYQSLYRSRGGAPEGLLALYSDTDGNDAVSLVCCRRCPSEIVTKANKLAESMPGETRELLSSRDGGKVGCAHFASARQEILSLADFLKKQVSAMGEQPKPEERTACLFPNRRMRDFYFERLSDAGVPCVKPPTPSEARQVLTIALRLSQERGQRFAERVLLEKASGIPRDKREVIVRRLWSEQKAITTFLPALLESSELSAVKPAGVAWLASIAQIVSGQAPELATGLTQLTGFAVGVEQAQEFLANVDDENLEDAIQTFCDTVTGDPAEGAGEGSEKSVDFLTIHASKGLTRKCVVLPGLEQIHFPGSSKGEELEEKRRMFYVALTRATERVIITFPRMRHSGDCLRRPGAGQYQPSGFIKEAGITINKK